MSDRETPYSAPWSDALQHRRDPNRVDGHRLPRTASEGAEPTPQPGGNAMLPRPQPQWTAAASAGASYYDVSLLQPPVWKWQISSYFFFGGVSAGAYLLARLAERFGGRRFAPVTRAGTWVAFGTVLPCPLLLIDDLGDPKRFHHMLRVFKPTSPMNLGTFVLTAYSGMVAAAVARQVVADRSGAPERHPGATGAVTRAWLLIHDAAGLPLAIFVAGYTGVLLSCTSNPLWCKNGWLGPLFSASAIATGAEAIQLLLDCSERPSSETEASTRVLMAVDTAAHLAEGACMVGYMRSAGERARPLKKGSVRRSHHFAIGALVASEVLKRIPVSKRWEKPVRMLSVAAGLAAGVALRHSLIYGGHEAASDPALARATTRAHRETSTAAKFPHQPQSGTRAR